MKISASPQATAPQPSQVPPALGESQPKYPRLNVLVLDEEIPYPLDSGKRIRTFNLLERLARRHSITLLCYGGEANPGRTALESAGIRVELVEPLAVERGVRLYLRLFANLFSPYPFSVVKHYTLRFQRAFEDLRAREKWDLIQCEWTPYARFIPDHLNIPLMISAHNVESQIWARRANHSSHPVEKLFFRTQQWKMRWFERRALRRAAGSTAVTEDDARTMREWRIPNVTVVPNGVDLDFYGQPSEPEGANEILALASLDWFPNVDSLRYFHAEIFPLIRKQQPAAMLRIVGRRPAESLRREFSGISGIDFIGEVENVRPYLDRAAVVVVPLRIGGGSRLKILEALAAGKAVVSTAVGAEGLNLAAGEDLVVADSPAAFARSVCELLGSREARVRLGGSGRRRVRENYGWDGIAQRQESAWRAVSRTPSSEAANAPARLHLSQTP
jgi:glycosyltransferase involved in cell wall biosynthesis